MAVTSVSKVRAAIERRICLAFDHRQVFNRVEVRAVWRQQPQLRASGFDQFSNTRMFVTTQIFQHHDLAATQGWTQEFVRHTRRIASASTVPSRANGAVTPSSPAAAIIVVVFQ